MTTDSNVPLDPLSLSDLGQKDRIQILLGEYTALRSEIMGRTGFGFQLAAIGAAVLTWLIQIQQSIRSTSCLFWIVLAVITAAYGLAIRINVRDLKRAAFRVKDLEHEINSRAGEHLLVWETLSGALTRNMGVVESLFSRIKPLPRTELQPLDLSYLERDAAQGNKRELPKG